MIRMQGIFLFHISQRTTNCDIAMCGSRHPIISYENSI